MLIIVHILTYIAQTVTVQENFYQHQTKKSVGEW